MRHWGCLYSTCPGGLICSQAAAQPAGTQGLFSTWGHPCRADAVLQRLTQPADTQPTPTVWPPASLGCYLLPMLLHRCLAWPTAGMLYAKYSGNAEDFTLRCLTGADGSSRSEHYRLEVSRWHGLSSNANLTEEPAFSPSSCSCRKLLSLSLLGTGKVVKGETSPGQGGGRHLGSGLDPLGLFLHRVKYWLAWGNGLLGL